MVSSLATLGTGCMLLVSTLALPPNRMIGTSAPKEARRSQSSLARGIDSITLPDLHLNTSSSIPTPSQRPIAYGTAVCDQSTIPRGWVVAPRKRQIESPIDCDNAIHRVTRGGDPEDPQVWESPADRSYRSCGVFLAAGWDYASVVFPRVDMAEIAQDIARRCVNPEHDFMGGWVRIGGYFIILLTGTELFGTQPLNMSLGSS